MPSGAPSVPRLPSDCGFTTRMMAGGPEADTLHRFLPGRTPVHAGTSLRRERQRNATTARQAKTTR
jgi:hypothetical protein